MLTKVIKVESRTSTSFGRQLCNNKLLSITKARLARASRVYRWTRRTREIQNSFVKPANDQCLCVCVCVVCVCVFKDFDTDNPYLYWSFTRKHDTPKLCCLTTNLRLLSILIKISRRLLSMGFLFSGRRPGRRVEKFQTCFDHRYASRYSDGTRCQSSVKESTYRASRWMTSWRN